MKKNNAVVFGLTSNHVFAVACVMMDIARIHPGLVDEVVILHDGIGEDDKKLLSSIMPCRFEVYEFPGGEVANLSHGILQWFSKMVFSKFECLRLLDDYKSVMWLDYDIVLKGGLQELFEYCPTGIRMMPSGCQVRAQLHEPVQDYDMDKEGICASTFVFQDHLANYREMYSFCYEATRRYAALLYLPEQAIFDFMIQTYALEISPIDRIVYSPHPRESEKMAAAKIIHAYGAVKFWNGIEDEQWNRNYSRWVAMGGSRYVTPGLAQKLGKRIVRFVNRLKARI